MGLRLVSTFSPDQDEDPDTPKYVRFRVKETVCGKPAQQLPEQCAFKEQGVRQKAGGGGRVPLEELVTESQGNISIQWTRV